MLSNANYAFADALHVVYKDPRLTTRLTTLDHLTSSYCPTELADDHLQM